MHLSDSPWLIDNGTPERSMPHALRLQIEKCGHGSIDIVTSQLTLGGWEAISTILPRVSTIRLLLGGLPAQQNDPITLAGLFLSDSEEKDASARAPIIDRLYSLSLSRMVQIRRTPGKVQANLYAFYLDKDFSRDEHSSALLGSSEVTRQGMYAERALNMLVEADPHPATIQRKYMRGLLDDQDNHVINMLDERVYVMAARAPAKLYLEHLRRWYQGLWDQADDYRDTFKVILLSAKGGE